MKLFDLEPFGTAPREARGEALREAVLNRVASRPVSYEALLKADLQNVD